MPRRHLRWILLAAATAIFVAAVLSIRGNRATSPPAPAAAVPRQPPNAPSAPPPPASLRPAPAADGASSALAIAAVEQALATGSLRGTTPDGAIELDAQGRLRHNLALKRWFDWHLSLVGEVPPRSIRAWIAEHLSRTQAAAVAAQVLRALDAYLAYLADVDRVAGMQQQAGPAQRLQLLKDLRRQHLGAEMAAGFFGEEEDYGDFTLARQALLRDPTLSPAERTTRLQALEEALPASLRQPLVQHRQVEADLARNAEIAAQSGDPLARFEAREREFGAEAAARLEQLDQEQAHWQQRLRVYSAARTRLLQDATPTGAEREARLAELRERSFDAGERQRVEALEQIDALPH